MQNALTDRDGVWGGAEPLPAYKMHNDYLEVPWFGIDSLIFDSCLENANNVG